MKPWIYPYKTLASSYFYDVNRNEIIKISSDTYDALELHKDLNYDALKTVANEEMLDLMQRGYLKANQIKRFEHSDTEFMKIFTRRKLNRVILQVTQDCNLRCSYCAYTDNNGTNRKHAKKVMEESTMRSAVDYIHCNSVDSETITISFYGGEPLLGFELMKQTVAYAKTKFADRPLKFGATVNGTLLTKEIIEFLIANNFLLVISLDGPKHINDKNRIFASGDESVFDKVISNMQLIRQIDQHYFRRISVNMVIDPECDFDDYKQLFLDYPFLNEVVVMSGLVSDDYKDEKIKFSDDFYLKGNYSKFNTLLKSMGYLNEIAMPFEENYFSTSYQDMIEPLESARACGEVHCPSGPCSPGVLKLFVTVDGSYLPCERVSESVERNIIGHVATGLDEKKCEQALNIAQLNYENCIECVAFRHCKICVKGYEDFDNNPQILKRQCNAQRFNLVRKLEAKAIYSDICEVML